MYYNNTVALLLLLPIILLGWRLVFWPLHMGFVRSICRRETSIKNVELDELKVFSPSLTVLVPAIAWLLHP